MGRISYTKIIILAACLAFTSIFVYWNPAARGVGKKVPLSQVMLNLEGWGSRNLIPLDEEIVKALRLDDYTNLSFSNGKTAVSLYIGYYLTAKKAGAPHSPLVCFPGQGWVISEAEKKSLTIGGDIIDLVTMTIAKGQNRQLIMYWFQAFDKTSWNTFFQKIYVLWGKLFYYREDNAFVRISIALGSQSEEEAFSAGTEFIEAFYPRFLKYVKENEM